MEVENEILTISKSPRERLEAFRTLMSRIDDYPEGSENFPRIQALILNDLAALALGDGDLDEDDV